MELINISPAMRVAQANVAEPSVQSQGNLENDIREISHVESSFLQRLRDLKARVTRVLSNAWQWLRNNVFCCCCSSGATDDGLEEVVAPQQNEQEAMADHAEILARLEQLNLDLPENTIDRHTASIVGFFYGIRTTLSGLSFNDILAYPTRNLEDLLSFDNVAVPYLFPLPTPTGINSEAPLLNPNTCEIFARNEGLRNLYLQGLKAMLPCWQLQVDANGVIQTMPNFDLRTASWLQEGSLHQLNMSYALKSLVKLGFEDLAINLKRLILREARDYEVPRSVKLFWIEALLQIPFSINGNARIDAQAQSNVVRLGYSIPGYADLMLPSYDDSNRLDEENRRNINAGVNRRGLPPSYNESNRDYGVSQVDETQINSNASVDRRGLPPSYAESNRSYEES